MEHILGQDWEIIPAGGATGEAFIATNEEQKLFLKRNSSPFLAVLSAEGIVPKLVWTKRLESGDVITAQRWLDGRELDQNEMKQETVARLLRKIHQSAPLLTMLKRLGKTPLKPEQLLESIEISLDEELTSNPKIKKAMAVLTEMLPHIECDEEVVCHCDVNHNNWLLSEDEQLFLIDWDGAMIADPAIDLGMLLHSYIPKNEWNSWLDKYGIELTDFLQKRMLWYVIAQSITAIQWHKAKQRYEEMNYWFGYLDNMLKQF
ncbi:phosphotransferase family protein [Bacillus massiliigorillae]|uniref:phosphotransferase family protein n=1 Tax=Bacillus massiliigorillae TaxID=1243664 RepID=UPI0003A44924|nr:phosphotransferase family protein [Bacillus massiliigorillae]